MSAGRLESGWNLAVGGGQKGRRQKREKEEKKKQKWKEEIPWALGCIKAENCFIRAAHNWRRWWRASSPETADCKLQLAQVATSTGD